MDFYVILIMDTFKTLNIAWSSENKFYINTRLFFFRTESITTDKLLASQYKELTPCKY